MEVNNKVDDNDYSLILDEDLNNSKENNMRIITRTRIQDPEPEISEEEINQNEDPEIDNSVNEVVLSIQQQQVIQEEKTAINENDQKQDGSLIKENDNKISQNTQKVDLNQSQRSNNKEQPFEQKQNILDIFQQRLNQQQQEQEQQEQQEQVQEQEQVLQEQEKQDQDQQKQDQQEQLKQDQQNNKNKLIGEFDNNPAQHQTIQNNNLNNDQNKNFTPAADDNQKIYQHALNKNFFEELKRLTDLSNANQNQTNKKQEFQTQFQYPNDLGLYDTMGFGQENPFGQIPTGLVAMGSQSQNQPGQQISSTGQHFPLGSNYSGNYGYSVPIPTQQIPMTTQYQTSGGLLIPMASQCPANNVGGQNFPMIPQNQQVPQPQYSNNFGQQQPYEEQQREENLFTEHNRRHESQESYGNIESQRVLEDHNRGIDLFETILFKLFRIGDNKRLDLNISIGIISRTFFFLAVINLRDLSNSQVGELVVFILSTLVFHIFIFTERYYIHLSFSLTRERELSFKITDSIQLLMIAIYLSMIVSTLVEILLLVLVYLNLVLSLLQILYIHKYRKYKPEKYIRHNGQFWLLFGLFFGCLMMLIIFFSLIETYNEQLKENSTFYFLVIAACAGSICGVIGSGYLACNQKNDWRTDFCKGILCLLYGFNLGLFSLLYGFIVGIIMFGMIFFYAHCWPLITAAEEVFFKKKKEQD